MISATTAGAGWPTRGKRSIAVIAGTTTSSTARNSRQCHCSPARGIVPGAPGRPTRPTPLASAGRHRTAGARWPRGRVECAAVLYGPGGDRESWPGASSGTGCSCGARSDRLFDVIAEAPDAGFSRSVAPVAHLGPVRCQPGDCPDGPPAGSRALCRDIPRLTELTVRRFNEFPEDHAHFAFPSDVVIDRQANVDDIARALCALPPYPG